MPICFVGRLAGARYGASVSSRMRSPVGESGEQRAPSRRTTSGVFSFEAYEMTPVMPMKALGKCERIASARSGESVKLRARAKRVSGPDRGEARRATPESPVDVETLILRQLFLQYRQDILVCFASMDRDLMPKNFTREQT